MSSDGAREEDEQQTRRKTEFWGYAQHDRSVLDVVDDEEWARQERWAVDESLGYARVTASPNSPISACHWCQKSFIDHFGAMCNDLLHEPLNICTATEVTQESTQEGLDAFN